MTPAAQVRRDFRLGRRPKLVQGDFNEFEPLHRAVVWQRANAALADLRQRMTAAGLKAEHTTAAVIYVEKADLDRPQHIVLGGLTSSSSEVEASAFETLGRDDVIALGMIFGQHDEQLGKRAIFPHLLMPLNAQGMAVLKAAAAEQYIAAELIKNVS